MPSNNRDQPYEDFDSADDFLPNERDMEEFQREVPSRSRTKTARTRTKQQRFRLLPKILLVLLAVSALLIVLNGTLLKIRHVRVFGNRTLTAQTVAEQAGLNRDMGFFTVDKRGIREKVEKNPYLEFVEIRKVFPDTLMLIVRERAPCANAQGGGALYLIDENAYVLQIFDTITPTNNLPVIQGMQISTAALGQQIVSSREGKVEEYCEIMQELLQQGVVSDIEQINLTDSSHLYLKHYDGFMVEIGTIDELMAKIGTMRAVVTALQQSGLHNGYIDLTIPGEAIYTPE